MKRILISLAIGSGVPVCAYLLSLWFPQRTEELAILLLPGFLVMWPLQGIGEVWESIILFVVSAVAWAIACLPFIYLIERLCRRWRKQRCGNKGVTFIHSNEKVKSHTSDM